MAKKKVRKKPPVEAGAVDPQKLAEELSKLVGDQSVELFSEKKEVLATPIPTGSDSLDVATGIGGIPSRGVTELYGNEGTGKSTLAMNICVSVARMGGIALYHDVEHAIDYTYAKALGATEEGKRIIFDHPDTMEEAFAVTEGFMEHVIGTPEKPAVVVFDSLAAMVPEAELEAARLNKEPAMALQARKMSAWLKQRASDWSHQHIALLFVNQNRVKIGQAWQGVTTITPCGRALRFYALMRIELYRMRVIKRKEKPAIMVRAIVRKSKVSSPFLQAEFEIIHGEGVHDLGVSVAEMDLDLLEDEDG